MFKPKYEVRQSGDQDREHCRFSIHSTRPGRGVTWFHLGTISTNYAGAVDFAFELGATLIVREEERDEFERINRQAAAAAVAGPTLEDECVERTVQ